jgi:glucose/arabinose dehydrogenase
MRRVLLLCACLLCVACEKDSDPSGGPGPGVGEPINGSERIGWDQQAVSATELATFGYLLYVDNVARELMGVACDAVAGPAGFPCRAPLPALQSGAHTLELSAYVDLNGRQESGRAGPLDVFVTSLTVPGSDGSTLTTSDGTTVAVGVMTSGFVEPTDLAFLPDGRVLVAERGGRIRPVVSGRLSAPLVVPGVDARDERGLLAIAPDANFAKNSWLYAVYTAETGLELARFRVAERGLVDRAVLMNHVEPTLPAPAASLRVGPDGKLYAAFDDGGEPERAGDLGSFAGKLLRMNADASTPTDQAAGTPVYATDVNAPHGVDWDREAALVWVLERDPDGQDRLQALRDQNAAARRGVPVVRYTLPSGTDATGLVAYTADLIPGLKGSLLVGGRESRSVLRFKMSSEHRGTILATERWISDKFGSIRAIGVGPDGAVYICNDDSLVRLSSDER